MTRGVLVLDFDGTVCLGDAPVFAYADALVRRLPDADRDAGGRRIRESLESYFAGRAHDLAAAPDGYYVVARLAAELGLGTEDRNAAYLESRIAVHAGEVPIFAPDGLRELLDDVRRQVRVVLVTNAPGEGSALLLEPLGLSGCFDEVRGDARKPAGMGPILDGLLEDAGIARSPERLLSVGDIWRNDLEPAAERGCVTALIDRFGSGPGAPTHRAATIAQLYPAIRDWARAAGAGQD